MGKKRSTPKSPEQRAAEAKDLHDRLAEKVATLASSEEWMKFLDFAKSFHSYSMNNVMLILMQCPEASRVAGFRQWQEKGRQVRKGEKAIKILGYSKKTVKEEGEDGSETTRTFARFPVLSVFDISQTDLMEGAEDFSDPVKHLTGEDELGIFATAENYLNSIGWTVSREPIAGESNGFTTIDGSKRVVIEATNSPAQQAKTILHESGHVLLDTDEDGKGDGGEYAAHRGIAETQAESVAYVLAGLFGLDTSDYSVGYIAGWSKGDVELIKATATNVMAAVKTLCGAFFPDEEKVEAA